MLDESTQMSRSLVGFGCSRRSCSSCRLFFRLCASVPCMLPKGKKKRSLELACSPAAQRRNKRPARDRSCPGAQHAVTEQDPRRPRDLSPNSRLSRSVRRSSSHSQDRDPVMESTPSSAWSAFVGIDVAKRTWDAHVLHSGRSLTVTADDDGLRKLLEELALPWDAA